jgi:uncharacterized oxidoreductase
MNTRGNTILITGGATGIGFAFAEAFARLGNKVIICGRREPKLSEAKARLPDIVTRVCDLSKPDEREQLHKWITDNVRNINMLINNAGIQRLIDLKKGISELNNGEDEVEINLKAQIHLCALFIPDFLKTKEAAIVNISSGLGFVPLAGAPIYCATKAAIHSYSLSLRHQLRGTSIKVFEIIPPIVNTELGGPEKKIQRTGIPPSQVAKESMQAFENNIFEFAIGMAEGLRVGSRQNPEETFQRMNH